MYARRGLGWTRSTFFPDGTPAAAPPADNPYGVGYQWPTGPAVDPISGVPQGGGGPIATGTVDGVPIYPGGVVGPTSGPIYNNGHVPIDVPGGGPVQAGLFGLPWWLIVAAVVGALALQKSKGGRDWR